MPPNPPRDVSPHPIPETRSTCAAGLYCPAIGHWRLGWDLEIRSRLTFWFYLQPRTTDNGWYVLVRSAAACCAVCCANVVVLRRRERRLTAVCAFCSAPNMQCDRTSMYYCNRVLLSATCTYHSSTCYGCCCTNQHLKWKRCLQAGAGG